MGKYTADVAGGKNQQADYNLNGERLGKDEVQEDLGALVYHSMKGSMQMWLQLRRRTLLVRSDTMLIPHPLEFVLLG